MATKTQNTSLWFIDPDTETLTHVTCVTAISGLGGAADQIETTCLESPARTYVPGLKAPGTATFTIQYAANDASMNRLHELYVDGTTDVHFIVGLGDGALTVVPTVDTAGAVTYPTTRTFLDFLGFVQDFPWDIALNAVVTNAIAIQVSGAVGLHPKAP
jgi:hypothetical protein